MSFSYALSPMQSKVARTYLNWTQEDLGRAADIDRSTVRSFENGYSPRRKSVIKIRKALEAKGIEFLEDDGVKRRGNEVKVYRGFDSCHTFYDDLLQTVCERGEDIHCVLPSSKALLRLLGGAEDGAATRLETLSQQATIKCLVSDPTTKTFAIPQVHFRLMPKDQIRPDFFLSYGGKYVNAVEDSAGDFIFVVFDIEHVTHAYRLQFLSMWADALPLSNSMTTARSLAAPLVAHV